MMWPEKLDWLDQTCPKLSDNLDLDMSLLQAAEEDPARSILRFWEWSHYGIVVGRSNVFEQEVLLEQCQTEQIPVIRRTSGGGTVVVGPGCLCYSLILPVPANLCQIGIAGVTRDVMQKLATALSTVTVPVSVHGISDLVVQGRKCGGNAQRWKSRAFLHHGTIMYDFDLARISRYLKLPLRQPEYRAGRSHVDFVTNLARSRAEIITDLKQAWRA